MSRIVCFGVRCCAQDSVAERGSRSGSDPPLADDPRRRRRPTRQHLRSDAVGRVPETASGMVEADFLASETFIESFTLAPYLLAAHPRGDGPSGQCFAVPGTPFGLGLLVLVANRSLL